MSGFTKLVPEIIQSSIWNEPSDIRIVWITLLAVKDENGFVRGDVRTIARLANVDVEKAQEALTIFQTPDDSSYTEDNDGRRIAPESGGWIVLNHEIYRAHDDIQREKTRIRVQKHREKLRLESCNGNGNVTESLPSASASVSVSSSEEGECEGEKPKKPKKKPKVTAKDNAELIYKAYPRKVGKGKAIASILAALKNGADVGELLEATQSYYIAVKQWPEDEQKFCPHPATWFNQQRWEDDRSAWVRIPESHGRKLETPERPPVENVFQAKAGQ